MIEHLHFSLAGLCTHVEHAARTLTLFTPLMQAGPEFAFIGHSNVGKSTLVNLITRNPSLAKVSRQPGGWSVRQGWSPFSHAHGTYGIHTYPYAQPEDGGYGMSLCLDV